jgi:phosphatidylglycerol:prolipoprotein diacylglycerol transferase
MEKLVTFPGLGLEFHLDPILLPITDSFGIHWYGAIIAVGFLLAVLWCCRQSSRFGIRQDDLIDMLFFAVPIGIIGARLYYVCFEFKNLYYVEGNVGETLRRIVRIWDGGLAIYGGVIAAVLTVLVVSRVKKISFPAFVDVGCMGLLIGQCIGRWGNFVNVEAFGSVTDVPWRMAGSNVASYLFNNGQVDADVYQQIVDGTLGVHPTFFYESLWNLVGFLLIAFVVARRRKFDGQVFLSYVAWYGIGRFGIESLRTDSLYVFGTLLRVSQLLAGISALAAIGLIAFGLWYGKAHGFRPLYVEKVQEQGNEKEKDDYAGENS